MINTLYIVLATYLIIKLLRFPLIDYVNSKRRRLVSRLVTLFSDFNVNSLHFILLLEYCMKISLIIL